MYSSHKSKKSCLISDTTHIWRYIPNSISWASLVNENYLCTIRRFFLHFYRDFHLFDHIKYIHASILSSFNVRVIWLLNGLICHKKIQILSNREYLSSSILSFFSTLHGKIVAQKFARDYIQVFASDLKTVKSSKRVTEREREYSNASERVTMKIVKVFCQKREGETGCWRNFYTRREYYVPHQECNETARELWECETCFNLHLFADHRERTERHWVGDETCIDKQSVIVIEISFEKNREERREDSPRARYEHQNVLQRPVSVDVRATRPLTLC